MDTRWFQDFIALAEVQNFTRAADLRNVTQPAFSRRIQALEQWVGAKLIDRATFPTRLTQAGEEFRKVAISLVEQIADARSTIGESPTRDRVRLALSYALASTKLVQWWPGWSGNGAITCALEVGNVHDTVSALSAGTVDILIGYHHASHPILVDTSRFEQHCLAVEKIRPYATAGDKDSPRFDFPGHEAKPVPLLMYSPSSYFSRIVELSIEQAPVPVVGYRAFESEMTEVLAGLACQGLGVSWLPDSSFADGRMGQLQPLGDGQFDVEISLMAYRGAHNHRPVVDQLWQRIVSTGDGA